MPTADPLLTSLTQKYNCTNEISVAEFYTFQEIVQASGNEVLNSEQSSSQVINRVDSLLTIFINSERRLLQFYAPWDETSIKTFPDHSSSSSAACSARKTGIDRSLHYTSISAAFSVPSTCCNPAKVMMTHMSSLK